MENNLPVIYLVDSAGVFLPMQDEIFPDKEHFGRIFRNNAKMSAMGITQIAAVMGPCVAGGAYLPIMSDETLMVEGHGSIFLAGPYLVKAAGENTDNETLGGAAMHTEISGIADYKFKTEEECLDRVKRHHLKNRRFFKGTPAAGATTASRWYAVHEPYGGPDAFKRFVDACHARGLGVVLDVVYNHLGPSGNYLPAFGPYFTDAHHTPWGQAVNLDAPRHRRGPPLRRRQRADVAARLPHRRPAPRRRARVASTPGSTCWRSSPPRSTRCGPPGRPLPSSPSPT